MASPSRTADPSLCEIPRLINLTLGGVHVAVHLYVFFILPFYLLPRGAGWAWTALPLVLLGNSFWSLIHEAIHDLAHPSARINRTIGRILSVLFGSPFVVLRLSHLLHHKLNRTPSEGTELYDPENISRARAGLGYYFQILGGLYLVEFLSIFPFLAPRRFIQYIGKFFGKDTLSGILWRSLSRDESVREIRVDGLAILVLLAFTVFGYGAHWPFLVAALAGRGFLISFLDNVYHYETPVNDLFYATNLWLPGTLSALLLYFNFHGIHHRNPAIPWIHLPVVYGKESRGFDGNYFAAAIRQLSGPIPLTELLVRGAGLASPRPL